MHEEGRRRDAAAVAVARGVLTCRAAGAGGSATMAYRDGDEKRCQVPRSKALIPVKSVVINLAADCSSGALIAARHPSGSPGASGVAPGPHQLCGTRLNTTERLLFVA